MSNLSDRARRAVVFLCLAALTLVVLAGCGGGGDDGSSSAPAVDPHKYELNPNPTANQQVGMDPDQQPEGGLDALTVVMPLAPKPRTGRILIVLGERRERA